MRVLVVDDDAAGRYLLESIVRSGQHEAIGAADGEEALARAREARPDLVISDILMPRMDGYQLCRVWKSDPDLSCVPFVFYTASYTDPADERFAFSLGADAFWRKPLDPATLLARLDEMVSACVAQPPRAPEAVDEKEVLERYSERLVHKLEQKAQDLERANAELRQAIEMLAKEIETKTNLVAELNADVQRRKQLEAELRQERDFTRRVIDVSDLAVVVLDSGGHIVLFSRGAEHILGYAAAEVIGHPWDQVIRLDAPEQLTDEVQRALAASGSAQTSLRVYDALGRRRMLDINVTVARDESGNVEAYHCFGIDVTERARAEVIESVASGMHAAVAAGAPLPVIVEAACQRIHAALNLAAVCVRVALPSGVSGAALVCSPWRRDPKEEHDLDAVLQEAARIGRPVVRHGAAPDDEAVQLPAHLGVPLSVEGAIVGAIAFTCPDARALDGALRATLERLAARIEAGLALLTGRDRIVLQSAALQSAADAIAIVDAEGCIRTANAAFEHLTGYGSDAHGQVRLDDLEVGPARPWHDVLRGEIDEWSGKVIGRRADGTRYHEELSVARIADLRTEEPLFVVVKRDITERTVIERLRSGFVANVSHELRTPLTTVLGYAELLEKLTPAAAAERKDELAARIRAGAARLKDLIEELLEVTTIQSEGGLVIIARPVDIEQLVRTHAELVPRTPDHRLRIEADPDMPLVSCDPDRLGRVIENLVGNAVKYSPQGGPIDVHVKTHDDEALIEVRDQGVGIPAEDIPTLFEQFTQADMSSTRAFGGVGLGLFVANEIVKAHGGRIAVESVPGRGSTFTIHLPLVPSHPA